ncbi:MAG: transcriptional regulator [Pseudomonadota bacterium]
MEIKPIRTEEHYEAAMARIDELWGIPADAPDADELEILLALTGVYEKKHHQVPAPDASAMLEFRMDQMGLTAEQIHRYIQCRERLPEILSRESRISLDIIRSLHDPCMAQSETT